MWYVEKVGRTFIQNFYGLRDSEKQQNYFKLRFYGIKRELKLSFFPKTIFLVSRHKKMVSPVNEMKFMKQLTKPNTEFLNFRSLTAF